MADLDILIGKLGKSIDNLSNKIDNFNGINSNNPSFYQRNFRNSSDNDTETEEYYDKRLRALNNEVDAWDSLTTKVKKYKNQISAIQEEYKKNLDSLNKSKDRLSELEEQAQSLRDTLTNPEDSEELKKIEGEILSEKKNILKYSEKIKENSNEIYYTERKRKDTIGEIYDKTKNLVLEVKKIVDPWGKIDQSAANYAKSVGTSAKGLKALRDETLKNVSKNKLAIKYDISAEELIKLQEKVSNNVGRNIMFSNEGQEEFAAMNAVMKENAADMVSKFENFGMSVTEAAKRSGRMFSNASKAGISFEKYSKNFLDNIRIAQNYTFKNGVKGLEDMAKKATAIKMDMQQIARLADKVQTVEGALDTAAKLQVLGGSFASLANPLEMMSEGLTNMEGLGDRVSKMIQGLGQFNKQTGEIEVSAFNKRIISAAAGAMGMEYSQLMESVNATARREEIARQIKVSGKSGLSDEMKELILNAGTFKEGKAGVNINGEFVELSRLDETYQKEIQNQLKSDSEDIKDIATILRGWDNKTSGFNKQKENAQARLIGQSKIGESFSKIIDILGRSDVALWTLIGLEAARGIIGKGGGNWRGFKNIFKKGKGINNTPTVSGGGFSNLSPADALGKPRVDRSRISQGFRNAKAGALKLSRKIPGKAGRAITGQIAKISAKGLLKGAGIGTVATLAGEGLGMWRDSLVEKGSIEKGRGVDNAMTVGKGALTGAGIGAMVGSFVPVIGTALGAGIGAVIGGLNGIRNAAKRRAENNLDKALSSTGIKVQGKYSRKELNKITSALATGKIDDKLKTRLLASGDSSILDEIDKRRTTENKISSSNREYVMNSTIKSANIRILSANLNVSDIVKPKLLTNTGSEAIKEPINSKRASNGGSSENINLNINGTIKLEGANGASVDISDKLINTLLRNDSFVRKLSKMIDYELRVNKNGAFRMTNIGDSRYA